MVLPEWCMLIKAATELLIELTLATCSLRTLLTNSLLSKILSTLRNHPTSAPTTAKWVRLAHMGAPATVLHQRWMAASCCAVGEVIRPGLRRSLRDVTALSTGAAMWAASTAPVHRHFTSAYNVCGSCHCSWDHQSGLEEVNGFEWPGGKNTESAREFVLTWIKTKSKWHDYGKTW